MEPTDHDPAEAREDTATLPPVRIKRSAMSALHDEAVQRSAEKGRPIYPRLIAAKILEAWAGSRALEKSKQRIAARDLRRVQDHGAG